MITQVKEKIARMSVPRGYSCLPVLITAGDVNASVIDDSYFFKIIDLRDYL